MKKLKNKILFRSILLTATSLLLLTTFLIVMSYKNTIGTLNKTISQTAQLAAFQVETRLGTSKTIMMEVGAIARLSNPALTPEEKKAVLNTKKETYPIIQYISMSYGNGIDLDGNIIREQEFFVASMEGKTYITDPIVDGKSSKFIISAPLWANGIPNSNVVGVVYSMVDGEFLSEITDKIKVGETGTAYIINSDFNVIAHKKRELVYSKDNSVKAAEQDESLKAVADLEKRAHNGEHVFGQYTYEGASKFIALSPINVNGWCIGVNVEANEYLQQTITTLVLSVVITLVAIIISVIFNIKLATSITKPVVQISEAAERLAEGDLNVVITHKGNDELGTLADAFNKTIESLNSYIKDIARGCREISAGNFNIEISTDFKGAFIEIANSIDGIIVTLSRAMKRN